MVDVVYLTGFNLTHHVQARRRPPGRESYAIEKGFELFKVDGVIIEKVEQWLWIDCQQLFKSASKLPNE